MERACQHIALPRQHGVPAECRHYFNVRSCPCNQRRPYEKGLETAATVPFIVGYPLDVQLRLEAVHLGAERVPRDLDVHCPKPGLVAPGYRPGEKYRAGACAEDGHALHYPLPYRCVQSEPHKELALARALPAGEYEAVNGRQGLAGLHGDRLMPCRAYHIHVFRDVTLVRKNSYPQVPCSP